VIFPRFDDEARAIGRDLSRVEKMVLVHFAIGEEELRAKKLRAGFIKNAATFDEPDPRRIDALGMSLDDELFREHYPLCGVVDDLIHVAEAYVTAGATHIVFCTGASPDLINSIGDKVLPKLR
jgi:alkanesulfonate monooxygenase SsuD/methylene tetrahydromethanopterin reductase-like flavin-dependent oxidoreductase (luciferase family)